MAKSDFFYKFLHKDKCYSTSKVQHVILKVMYNLVQDLNVH